ncbi:MAG: glycosyl transferase, family 9 [Mycobacterium sp.]|nr:glycosyl transferase, family 9 [Mycobacterium sp.]
MTRVLVARLDSDGDVLLAGPAVRAVAAGARELTLLCGPAGRQAAALLPGVDRVLEWAAPWIQAEPAPVRAADVDRLVGAVRAARIEAAVVLTSFHQSALPLALLLRLAGVGHLTAISEDYPGSLLDVRHHVPELIPEPERALSVAAAAGFGLPPGDDGRLRVRGPLPDVDHLVGTGAYVVVHPGATVPARACPPALAAEVVRTLAGQGRRVVVTGGPAERPLTAQAAGADGTDLGGRTSFAELAAVLAGADAVVVGNTGPAHLAAAVGTPVVSLFAPTVPYEKWRPYGVATVRLGDQQAACRGTRARICPVPGHPCLATVSAADVVGAVAELEGIPA